MPLLQHTDYDPLPITPYVPSFSRLCRSIISQHSFASPRRDESASATYFFREKTASEKANKSAPEARASAQDHLVREWMYYRSLQRGESEFPLRNKQVSSLSSRDPPQSSVSQHFTSLCRVWVGVMISSMCFFFTCVTCR